MKSVFKSEWRYNALYILTWYFFSTALSVYNKTLMGKDHYNFNLPLLMSAVHSGIHTLITRVFIKYSNQKVQRYSNMEYFVKLVPCGIAAAVEICCANASLVLITLSFYTMIKSSTPVWVLIFSFMFGFEKPRINLIAVISCIVFGVWLTIDGEPKFDTKGFILVLTAAVASGLRWNMTQYLMKSSKGNIKENSPLATMYHLSPIMFITMLMLSLIIEKPFHQQPSSIYYFDSLQKSLMSVLIMSFGGVLAFIMTIAELYLIKGTSTVTLSVAGISKEIVVISLSVLIYGDELTLKTYMG
ncbi:triose-phosphate transporter family-domain-containing protein [Mucor mucedo]|uniref:triose-phosphate transporter family-domain-containing protein n=1 Tax=Mucor mucedo TaxID=29922 RepID=UPI00222076FE|nr:triose-phosphate transporter family-domain-containing protein [Mucor mucedo]KAI7894288.1 triose-phosphate transporter family-domain-containing protein [Mucor mucedo]